MNVQELMNKVKGQFEVSNLVTESASIKAIDYSNDYLTLDEPVIIVYKDKDGVITATPNKNMHYVKVAQILGVEPIEPVALTVDDIEVTYSVTTLDGNIVKADVRVNLTDDARAKYNDIIVNSLKARSVKRMYANAIKNNGELNMPQL